MKTNSDSTMDYHALPDQSPDDIPTEDEKFSFLTATRKSKRNLGVTRLFYILTGINVALILIQVVLLVLQVMPKASFSSSNTISGTYGFDTNYMTLDHGYDWVWEERAIEKAGAITLSKNDDGSASEVGVISMFHQLHCVSSLRKALQNAYEGHRVAFNQEEDRHWPHCMHYLHQMIMCNADSQIERQHLWNHTLPFVSGAEDVRECRDSQALFDLFEQKGS